MRPRSGDDQKRQQSGRCNKSFEGGELPDRKTGKRRCVTMSEQMARAASTPAAFQLGMNHTIAVDVAFIGSRIANFVKYNHGNEFAHEHPLGPNLSPARGSACTNNAVASFDRIHNCFVREYRR